MTNVAPLEPGLSYDEIVVVGKGGGYQEGELNDAIRQAGLRSFGNGRFKPDVQYLHWEIFGFDEEPEYRDFRAFDVIDHGRDERHRRGGRNPFDRTSVVRAARRRAWFDGHRG
jgi:hypothetical protein